MNTQETASLEDYPTVQDLMDCTTDTLLRSGRMHLQYLTPGRLYEHTIKYLPDQNKAFPYCYGIEDRCLKPQNCFLIRDKSIDNLLKTVPVNLSLFKLVPTKEF